MNAVRKISRFKHIIKGLQPGPQTYDGSLPLKQPRDTQEHFVPHMKDSLAAADHPNGLDGLQRITLESYR